MPSLSFEGETHDDIVRQVRRWLTSTEERAEHLDTVEVVERVSQLTKDALSVVAAAAPQPVAHSEVVKGLTRMGYEATDQTAKAVVNALNAVAELSNGRLLGRIESAGKSAGRSAVWEMQSGVARQILRALRPPPRR